MPAHVNKPGSINSARNKITQRFEQHMLQNSYGSNSLGDISELLEESNLCRMRQVPSNPQPIQSGNVGSRNAEAPQQSSANVPASFNLQQSLQDFGQEILRVQSENQRLLAKSAEDGRKIEDLQRKAEESTRQHEIALKDLETKTLDLQKQLKVAVAANEQVDVGIKILERENHKLRVKDTKDEATIHSLHDELFEARKLRERAEAKCAQLARDLQHSSRSYSESAAEISQLREQLGNANSRIETEISERTSKASALEQQMSESEANFAQLQATHSKSVQERCQLGQQVNKLKRDLKSEQTKFERESKLVKELQVAALKQRLATIGHDCGTCRSCYHSFSLDDASKHKLALIPCGHCFCRSCVQAVEAVAMETGSPEQQLNPDAEIYPKCPFCLKTIDGKLQLKED